ncbi:beta-lactamase family protein, partial [Bacteroidales bacterium OttesenSCG-928-J19]|nr:beta-lactamase family protein [Bacteroidales bacterium OttesenSCG-928-J19]
MKAKLLALCLFLISLGCYAQSFDRAQMDSLFSLIEDNEKGMGALSIFQDGQEVYQRTYGYADLENRQKANKETKYRIGSISKTFTATVIMKLIEEGKLSLDTFLHA